ncbi:tpd52 like 2a isoform X10 [Pangasianodon hypophthalmus]|uniref:tpd52 like 2a isoform X10 n=1 Tax=Pangasianodon hypophthalmus TaxID=310915 RepID=UPI000EFDEB81|nr:tpd52 like 2a isoform X10 [Pangasianodon hypophthalmus]
MQMDSGDRGSFTEGGASARTLPPGLTEQEAVELELELSKVEDEIQTLRHVLTAKERHAGELRRRLGISPLTELKSNLTKGWHEVQSSNAYKKTQETLSQAGMMTSSAFSSLGSAIRSRLGEMRALTYTPPSGSSYSMRHSLSMPTMRNSPTFKNLEDKMAGKGSTNGEDA